MYGVRPLAELPGVSGERLAKHPALSERETLPPRAGVGIEGNCPFEGGSMVERREPKVVTRCSRSACRKLFYLF